VAAVLLRMTWIQWALRRQPLETLVTLHLGGWTGCCVVACSFPTCRAIVSMCQHNRACNVSLTFRYVCFNDTDDVAFNTELVETATIRAASASSNAGRFQVLFTRDAQDCAGATNSSSVTTYTVQYQGTTMLLADAALILRDMDLLSTCVFLALCLYLAHRIRQTTKGATAGYPTLTQYAVFVRDLPPFTTKLDIRRHFDRLYNPTRRTWYHSGYCFSLLRHHRSRETPVIINPRQEFTQSLTPAEASMKRKEAARRSRLHFRPRPVRSVSHLASDPFAWAFKGGWVADVTILRCISDSYELSHGVKRLYARWMQLKKRVEYLRVQARESREGRG